MKPPEFSIAVDEVLSQTDSRLTHKPQWLVLSTATGEFLGSMMRRFPSTISVETDRITALTAASAGNLERRAMELKLGSIQYGVSVGDQGFEIVVFLANDWVLSMKFAEAQKAVLIETLQNLSEVVDPIYQLSKKGRGDQ